MKLSFGSILLFAVATACACSVPRQDEIPSPVTPSPRVPSPGVPARGGPEQRAVEYLAGEVSRWRKENGCYSCHNNGDAVRALMTAERQSFRVKDNALTESLEFIAAPDLWDANNKGNPAFSDQDLARVQFAAALVTASELGYVRDARAVERGARLVADLQAPDGSWRLGPPDTVGAPATYGRFLATHMALRTLRHAKTSDLRARVENGESWLRQARPKSVLDAAALLLALGGKEDSGAVAQTEECLELVRRGQAANGGWGPYVNSPAEVFDTAVVLIALAGLESTPETTERIARGRAFLLASQEPGGGWPETTRPSGSQSYAQHISTSGWATLALLATRR